MERTKIAADEARKAKLVLAMKEGLDKEKKVTLKQWAKREEQIDRVMLGTVRLYGDLRGIAGKTIQEIEVWN